MKHIGVRLGVKQHYVDVARPLATNSLGSFTRRIPLPHNLIPKVFRPENHIQHHLEVVAGGGVAVEVEAPRRFQHAVEFNQARRHHHEVGGEVVPAERIHKAFDEARQGFAGALQQEGLVGVFAPLPCVGEGFDLRLRGFARLFLEQ
jgi:hypothetical protein